jgi:trk system potassium uptake protein TrkA
MNIIIVGCGRGGSRLGRRLAESGNHVAVVDVDRAAFNRLGPNFQGSTYQGSGLDQEVLSRAGVENTDIVYAMTGGDNRNLMIAQLVKIQFDVKNAVARLHDPVRAQKYHEMGLETICTTTVITGLLEYHAANGKFPELACDLAIHGDHSMLQETRTLEEK